MSVDFGMFAYLVFIIFGETPLGWESEEQIIHGEALGPSGENFESR